MTLYFFEAHMAAAFIATCQQMGIHGTQRKTEDAPRHHVTAHCADEKQKNALTEAWAARSMERKG